MELKRACIYCPGGCIHEYIRIRSHGFNVHIYHNEFYESSMSSGVAEI